MATILIVDDDPDIVEAVRLVLERAGHDVRAAGGPEDGLRKAREPGIDLLILDVMMGSPDDGIVMAQELRRGGFTAPILMLTSIAQATGFAYGRSDAVVPVDDFVEKPVGAEVLLRAVERLLARPAGEAPC